MTSVGITMSLGAAIALLVMQRREYGTRVATFEWSSVLFPSAWLPVSFVSMARTATQI